jgi:hypothetical protein
MCNSSRMNLRRTSSVFSAAGGSTVSSVEKDISQLKQSVNIHDQRLNTNDQDMRGFHHRISELEGARDELSVLTSEWSVLSRL